MSEDGVTYERRVSRAPSTLSTQQWGPEHMDLRQTDAEFMRKHSTGLPTPPTPSNQWETQYTPTQASRFQQPEQQYGPTQSPRIQLSDQPYVPIQSPRSQQPGPQYGPTQLQQPEPPYGPTQSPRLQQSDQYVLIQSPRLQQSELQYGQTQSPQLQQSEPPYGQTQTPRLQQLDQQYAPIQSPQLQQSEWRTQSPRLQQTDQQYAPIHSPQLQQSEPPYGRTKSPRLQQSEPPYGRTQTPRLQQLDQQYEPTQSPKLQQSESQYEGTQSPRLQQTDQQYAPIQSPQLQQSEPPYGRTKSPRLQQSEPQEPPIQSPRLQQPETQYGRTQSPRLQQFAPHDAPTQSPQLQPSEPQDVPTRPKGYMVTPKPLTQVELCEDTFKNFVEKKPGLRRLFPDSKFGEYATKGADMVAQLLKKGCPPEMAQEFAVLVLYDLVILLDDSHSIVTGDDSRRAVTLFRVLKAVVEVYRLARDGGLTTVHYLNGRQVFSDVTTPKLKEVHANIRYSGITMLGTQLQKKILKPFIEQKPIVKPLLTMVITDGNIEGEREGLLEKNIYNCLARLQQDPEKTEDAIAFMFARIGDDPDGKDLIEELNNHPIMGSWIGCLPVDQNLEDFGHDAPSHWLLIRKLLLGALDDEINGQDEDEDIVEDNRLVFIPRRAETHR